VSWYGLLRKIKNNLKLRKAEITGIIAFLLAIILVFYHPFLATIPLMMFVALCIGASFFPRVNFFFPVICRGTSGNHAVSLTFDDGPDPLTTPLLLNLLSEFGIKATFFVTGKNVDKHPNLIIDILHDGHSIGNHTYHHDNFIMLKKKDLLVEEIKQTQDILKKYGIRPLTFRPPVGIVNPALGNILFQLNMIGVNFSCRASDYGNRIVKHLSKKILTRVSPDDIIMLHDIPPKDRTLVNYWLNEVRLVLLGLEEKGLLVLPLSELIEKEVMDLG